jgi:hypothetical protein
MIRIRFDGGAGPFSVVAPAGIAPMMASGEM